MRSDEELFDLGWLDPSRIRPTERMSLAANVAADAAAKVTAAHGVRVVVVVLPPEEVNGEPGKVSVAGSGPDVGQTLIEAAANLTVLAAMVSK